MEEMIKRGGLQSFTLRFLDPELEGLYQVEEGAAGLTGYRIITGATAVLWLIGAALLPFGSDIPASLAWSVGGSMAVVGAISLIASRWAPTMNRQHALASMLTSANGLVLLLLAVAGEFVEGYAVGAIMLLFLFGFVSRTRFVYAAVRTAVIAVGLGVVAVVYSGPGSLLIDVFFFVAAAAASLIGLRLLERNRRFLWHQRMVVEEQTEAIDEERAESERLLLNVLPEPISRRLRQGESPIADEFAEATVMFADIVGFTPLSAEMAAEDVITLLSDLFSMFDDLVDERGLEKIKTIGDAYMVVGGIPQPVERHAIRMIDLALAMLHCTRTSATGHGLTLRIGVHAGPVAGGVIGHRKFAYDVWGSTVNMASRLEASGLPGRIQVSEEMRALTEADFQYEPRGTVELRGLGAVNTYLVVEDAEPGDPESILL